MDLFKLQIFAEGGEGGNTGGETGSVAVTNNSKGVLSNVRYGKQADAVGETDTQPSETAPRDMSAEFDDLIKGEYKDAFTKKTQGIIDQRFKETKILEEYRNDVTPIIDALYTKYGVSDIAGLRDAIENDDSYWEQRAEAKGLTVDQFKTVSKLEAENAKFRRMQDQRVRERQAQEQYQKWIAEGEEVKKAYPQFDLATESQNPRFVDLLVKGINVQTAFEVIHMNDIKMMSAQARQKAVVNSVRANGLRPSENGVARQAGVQIKSDVHKLTKEDRREIARRRARGEHIEF